MKELITRNEAILALTTGKRGTLFLARNKDGLLTCTYSTGQTYEVVSLHLLAGDQFYDEYSFNSYLFIRSHKEKEKTWYLLLDQTGQTEVASSSGATSLVCIALLKPMSPSVQKG